MNKYGIENVRGGSFCETTLSVSSITIIKKMITSSTNKCFTCGEEGHFANECNKSSLNKTCHDKNDIQIKQIVTKLKFDYEHTYNNINYIITQLKKLKEYNYNEFDSLIYIINENIYDKYKVELTKDKEHPLIAYVKLILSYGFDKQQCLEFMITLYINNIIPLQNYETYIKSYFVR